MTREQLFSGLDPELVRVKGTSSSQARAYHTGDKHGPVSSAYSVSSVGRTIAAVAVMTVRASIAMRWVAGRVSSRTFRESSKYKEHDKEKYQHEDEERDATAGVAICAKSVCAEM